MRKGRVGMCVNEGRGQEGDIKALRQYISGIRLLNLNTAFTEQVNAEEWKFNQ